MMTKLLAGACALALTAASESLATGGPPARAHSTTVRVSVPVGCFGEGSEDGEKQSGRASLASAFAGRRWRLIAAWSSGASRLQIGVAVVSEATD